MRCDQCNKFVSFDADSDPEMELEVAEDGALTGSVRIVNNCAECGTELKEANFDVDDSTITDELSAHRAEEAVKIMNREKIGLDEARKIADELHTIESHEDDGGSRDERMQDTDRRGKKIKSARYMTHYYGFSATVTATCRCGWTCEASISDEIPGSGMDELV